MSLLWKVKHASEYFHQNTQQFKCWHLVVVLLVQNNNIWNKDELLQVQHKVKYIITHIKKTPTAKVYQFYISNVISITLSLL